MSAGPVCDHAAPSWPDSVPNGAETDMGLSRQLLLPRYVPGQSQRVLQVGLHQHARLGFPQQATALGRQDVRSCQQPRDLRSPPQQREQPALFAAYAAPSVYI